MSQDETQDPAEQMELSFPSVIAAYSKQKISSFDPPKPRPYVFPLIVATGSRPLVCSHKMYGSPDEFVDLLLWLQHPKSFQDPIRCDHFKEISFQTGVKMCTHCINLLLSRVHLTDFFNLYSLSRREVLLFLGHVSPDYMTRFYQYVYPALMFHSKFHRILGKAIALSKAAYLKGERQFAALKEAGKEAYIHDFDFICDVIEGEIQQHGIYDQHYDHSTLPVFHSNAQLTAARSRRFMYIRCLFLSVKYWTKYNVLFYINRYLNNINSVRNELWKKHEDKGEDPYLDGCIFYIAAFMRAVCKRAIDCNLICGHGRLFSGNITDIEATRILCSIYQSDCFEFSKGQNETCKDLRQNMTCCWSECSKYEREIDVVLKVCGGCKLSYYCSRKCQKKAWKAGHWKECSTLKKYYHL